EVQQSASLSVGTVSTTANTLDGLQASLSEKASAAGAKSFRIISATGNENQMRGVAELYN
ncbi:multiple stress resistance protein BhsA, partial [Dickeya dadantii]